MAVDIRVPPLGESLVDAVVGTWLKQEGDSVNRGDSLVELETDKVNLDVTAEEDGVLARIERREGEVVTVGEVLGLVSGSNGASAPASETATTATAAAPEPTPTPAAETPQIAATPPPAAAPAPPVLGTSAASEGDADGDTVSDLCGGDFINPLTGGLGDGQRFPRTGGPFGYNGGYYYLRLLAKF